MDEGCAKLQIAEERVFIFHALYRLTKKIRIKNAMGENKENVQGAMASRKERENTGKCTRCEQQHFPDRANVKLNKSRLSAMGFRHLPG